MGIELLIKIFTIIGSIIAIITFIDQYCFKLCRIRIGKEILNGKYNLFLENFGDTDIIIKKFIYYAKYNSYFKKLDLLVDRCGEYEKLFYPLYKGFDNIIRKDQKFYYSMGRDKITGFLIGKIVVEYKKKKCGIKKYREGFSIDDNMDIELLSRKDINFYFKNKKEELDLK